MSLPASGSQPSAADEPLITALVAERCPACGARLGPAAQWCSLCFADLRPAPVEPVQPVEVSGPPAPVTDALPSRRAASAQTAAVAAAAAPTATAPAWATAMAPSGSPSSTSDGTTVTAAPASTVAADRQPGGIARPTWPCTSCGVSVDVDLDACPACGAGFLGSLRGSSSGLELPVVGDLGRFSQRSRIVLAAAVGLGLAIIMVLITALLGH